MIIQKFGGTSVADAKCLAGVADIITEQHNLRETVIVVSAMSGVTAQLISGARAAAEGKDATFHEIKTRVHRGHLDVVETLLDDGPQSDGICAFMEEQLEALERLYTSISVLGELTARVNDAVVCFGEQLSASILAAVLRRRGLRAQAVHATELIVTDDSFGSATPLLEPTQQRLKQQVRPLLARGVIPVITGYIAATKQGVPTTLGRSGSDYSATIIAACLGADEVWIWTDVNGILTADPNIVPQARPLRELSYTEAANLARFGAEVLHPRTIRPVIANSIPLRILNSFNPTDPGTLVVKTPSPDRVLLPAIVSATGLSLITVGSQAERLRLQMAIRSLQRLNEEGLTVLMFSQSYSEQGLNLVVREQDQAHCLRVLADEFANRPSWALPETPISSQPSGMPTPQLVEDGCALGTREKVATVSVIGVPGWNKAGIASCAFAALGKHGVRVIAVAQATTEDSVSFCIPQDEVAGTVRFLHRELGLEGKSRQTG